MEPLSYNTKSLAHSKFRPHGYIEATADGNLLRHQAWGPFNDELVVAYAALEERLLPQMLTFARWGDLVLFHGSAMAPRSAFDAFAVHLLQRARLGQAAHVTALVMPPEVEGGEIMAGLFLNLYRDAGLLLQSFEDMAVAERWIRAELARGA